MRLLFLLVIISLLSCNKKDENPTPTQPPPKAPTITNISPMHGKIGTEVMIKGTNFVSNISGNIVKFNGTGATITQANDTQLTTTVPSGATTGKISVTSNNLSTSSTDSFQVIEGVWTQKADYGGSGRNRAAGFSIGNKGYIVGGYTGSTGIRENDLWEYDPQTDQWTKKADFPGVARENAVAFTIGGKGYICTGYIGGDYARDLWEYDPVTNQWTQKANFPGHPREWAVAFSAGGKGYVSLGVDFYTTVGVVYPSDLWEYDPQTNQWMQKKDFPDDSRSDVFAFAVNDKGYVGSSGNNTNGYKDLWEYNPLTNEWLRKADFPGEKRSGGIGFSIADKGYFGFGYNQSDKNDFWEYNPQTNQWVQKNDFPGITRDELIGFGISNKGYIGTGTGGTNFLKDFWEFSPQ